VGAMRVCHQGDELCDGGVLIVAGSCRGGARVHVGNFLGQEN